VTQLVLATRSEHKANEIRRILAQTRDLQLVTLRELGIEESAAEEELESAPTFLGNATAKAAYFARRLGRPTLADDSGLEVDALDHAPGVRTRRFALDAGFTDLTGTALDLANNQLLLQRLKHMPAGQRAARYVCAAALATPDAPTRAALGTCQGEIALTPSGQAGFGYDPLFWLPDLHATFAQLAPEIKDARSHRARAFRALATILH
jgi:XTP/dITP diphosphohydrolase